MITRTERVPRTIVVLVAATDAQVFDALSGLWDRIRHEDQRVPGASFELQPGRSSSCGTVEWDVAPHIVLNLRDDDGQNLAGRVVLERVLHLAAHAASRGSSGAEGRYHNHKFADAARKLGLTVVDVAVPGTGFVPDGLARGTLTRFEPEIRALDKALSSWRPVTLRKRDRGPQPYACSCDPPRRLRMNTGQADKGPVICGICGEPFELVSAS